MKEKLKKKLYNSPETRQYINLLPKLWLFIHDGQQYRYVLTHFAGWKEFENNVAIPLIYQYEGQHDIFRLTLANDSRNGTVLHWTSFPEVVKNFDKFRYKYVPYENNIKQIQMQKKEEK